MSGAQLLARKFLSHLSIQHVPQEPAMEIEMMKIAYPPGCQWSQSSAVTRWSTLACRRRSSAAAMPEVSLPRILVLVVVADIPEMEFSLPDW